MKYGRDGESLADEIWNRRIIGEKIAAQADFLKHSFHY